MSSILLRSPAKINLCLDILGKDERSQKHFVNTILYRFDELSDEIELRPIAEDFNRLLCEHPEVPRNEENTILKAMNLLGIKGFEISLWKKIPVGSGLGGAASNAGTILKYFGKERSIPETHLLDLAKKIGSDVPFFVLDENLAYFEGFGDHFMQSWNIDPLPLEIIDTGITVLTKDAYAEINLDECGKNSAKTEALLMSLRQVGQEYPCHSDLICHPEPPRTINMFLSTTHNDFESLFFKHSPHLRGKGHLCGSGGAMWKMKSYEI